jgi:hypothetical protein
MRDIKGIANSYYFPIILLASCYLVASTMYIILLSTRCKSGIIHIAIQAKYRLFALLVAISLLLYAFLVPIVRLPDYLLVDILLPAYLLLYRLNPLYNQYDSI